MNLNQAINKVVRNWFKIRDYYAHIAVVPNWDRPNTAIGTMQWDNPDLAWVLLAGQENDYDGSHAQVGVSSDGRLMFEFQSHCSCNGYGDTHGLGYSKELEPALETNSWEISHIPEDWQEQIIQNVEKLLAVIKTDYRA